MRKQGIINLTPHNVNVVLDSGAVIEFKKNSSPARVTTESVRVDFVEGLPIFGVEFGELENLPELKRDVFLIVSRMVAAAAPERTDLLVPSGLVRDTEGIIIGCKGFEQPNA